MYFETQVVRDPKKFGEHYFKASIVDCKSILLFTMFFFLNMVNPNFVKPSCIIKISMNFNVKK